MGLTSRINALAVKRAAFSLHEASVGLQTNSVNENRHRSINQSTLSLFL